MHFWLFWTVDVIVVRLQMFLLVEYHLMLPRFWDSFAEDLIKVLSLRLNEIKLGTHISWSDNLVSLNWLVLSFAPVLCPRLPDIISFHANFNFKVPFKTSRILWMNALTALDSSYFEFSICTFENEEKFQNQIYIGAAVVIWLACST